MDLIRGERFLRFSLLWTLLASGSSLWRKMVTLVPSEVVALEEEGPVVNGLWSIRPRSRRRPPCPLRPTLLLVAVD